MFSTVFLIATFYSKSFYTVTDITEVPSVTSCRVLEKVLWEDNFKEGSFGVSGIHSPVRTMCVEVKEDGTRVIHTDRKK